MARLLSPIVNPLNKAENCCRLHYQFSDTGFVANGSREGDTHVSTFLGCDEVSLLLQQGEDSSSKVINCGWQQHLFDVTACCCC